MNALATLTLIAANDELDLVRRALAGREDAVGVLIRRLMPVIRARVRRRLARERGALGPTDGEDLIQEVWLRLIEDEGRLLLGYDSTRGATLEGYVGIVAEREIGNLVRKAGAKKRGGHLVAIETSEELPSSAGTPEETAQAQNLADRLGEHLEKELPPKGWLVFRYAFTDALAPDEIARILNVNVQVVYNWQHKIRAVARAFLSMP